MEHFGESALLVWQWKQQYKGASSFDFFAGHHRFLLVPAFHASCEYKFLFMLLTPP
jgi:hypothetical protein